MEEKHVHSYRAQLIRVKECLICIGELPVGEVPEFKKSELLRKSGSCLLMSLLKQFLSYVVPHVYHSYHIGQNSWRWPKVSDPSFIISALFTFLSACSSSQK